MGISNFYTDKRKYDKLRSYCKACESKYNKIYYKKHLKDRKEYSKKYYKHTKHRNRENNLNRKYVSRYGITINEKRQMAVNQNYKCLICNKKFNNPLSMNVDHDKITGKVRGLLCNNCNRGIGHLQHNVNILAKAIKYLRDNN
jgi:hypothetical protein